MFLVGRVGVVGAADGAIRRVETGVYGGLKLVYTAGRPSWGGAAG